VGNNGEALPKTRSEEKRWSSEVRKRLPEWVVGAAQPTIANALAREGLAAAIRPHRSCVMKSTEKALALRAVPHMSHYTLQFASRKLN
jgi:hypothetical protein